MVIDVDVSIESMQSILEHVSLTSTKDLNKTGESSLNINDSYKLQEMQV